MVSVGNYGSVWVIMGQWWYYEIAMLHELLLRSKELDRIMKFKPQVH